jgi:FATC domain
MTIKGKLGGQINKEELPLSAEGQVDELIRMAASPARLVQMYIGKPPKPPISAKALFRHVAIILILQVGPPSCDLAHLFYMIPA